MREAVRQHPDRFIGEYHADPTNIMAAVRGLQEHVEKYGFKVLRIEPFMWSKPPTDPCYYPLYAKCIELDVAFQTQVGHTGPLYPSETGRPIYIDQVALDFPELRIICGHIGWPWTEEMIAVAWKHANVFIDTSAHVPKHYPTEFVHFMKTLRQAQGVLRHRLSAAAVRSRPRRARRARAVRRGAAALPARQRAPRVETETVLRFRVASRGSARTLTLAA